MERAAHYPSSQNHRSYIPLREHFDRLLVPLSCLQHVAHEMEHGTEFSYLLETLIRDLDRSFIQTCDKLEGSIGQLEVYYSGEPEVGEIRRKSV